MLANASAILFDFFIAAGDLDPGGIDLRIEYDDTNRGSAVSVLEERESRLMNTAL